MRLRLTRRWGNKLVYMMALIAVPALALGAVASGAASREHVLKVRSGLDMLDVEPSGKPTTGATILKPVMSADGHHVAYGFDVGNAREYGLIWRDLKSGRTVRLDWGKYYPYALAMSASGRYVVYSAMAKAASNGYVTGMNVWLWDTRTEQRTIISRLPYGRPAQDGSTFGVSISANGRWVAFESSSELLAPAGAIEEPSNTESNSYVYLYDRVTKTLTPVPWSASFTRPTAFHAPVISADGAVVAFRNGLEAPMVWYPSSGLVRPVPLAAEIGASDAEGLALSADGGELAASAFGVDVVALGASAETDRLLWSEPRPEKGTESVALSADGSKLAFTGAEPTQAPTSSRIWLADVAGGPASALPLPPVIRKLPAAPRPVGGLSNTPVTMTADGSAVATVMCSRGYKSPNQCSSRMDFFRWKTGF